MNIERFLFFLAAPAVSLVIALVVVAKMAEMGTAGWIFLRGTAASPLRTIRSWGGGLMLHFIRNNESSSEHAA
jgi:hypothetical protein